MKKIKDIAIDLNVTPQSVRNEMARQSMETLQSKNSRGFALSDEDAERIKTAFMERRERKAQSKKANFNAKQSEIIFALQRQLDEKAEQLRRQDAILDRLTATVQDQAENMRALTAAIESTTQALHAAQALHAGTIQERLDTKEDESRQQPEQKKAGFWKRLFRE